MSSGSTSQDPSWKSKEQGEEAQYIREREREQFEALRQQAKSGQGSNDINATGSAGTNSSVSVSNHPMDRDFEGGFGGQEDLEDRYATTSGEH